MGRHPTALEVVQGNDLTGKVALVTGGSSGIGIETVRAFATAGATVILACRNAEAGQKVAGEIKASGAKGPIVVKKLDLADLSSVHAFTKDLLANWSRLHNLILNAGVMACPKTLTTDGFEMQIGTNHLGHFALVHDLLPKLQSEGYPVRIVAVSSSGHKIPRLMGGGVFPEDLHFKNRRYNDWGAYGQSKLANVLFTKELARRYAGTNIKAYSLHPGGIMTNLQRHQSALLTKVASYVLAWMFITPEQGAATSVYAATAPELEDQSGAYLTACKVAQPSAEAQDAELAKRLWEVSLQEIGAPAE